MKIVNDSVILRNLFFIESITPNDQELGSKLRPIIRSAIKSPERTCEIDDDGCLNCGSWKVN